VRLSQCKKSPAETDGALRGHAKRGEVPAEPYFKTNSHAPSSRYPTHSRPRPKIEGRQETPTRAQKKNPAFFKDRA